MTERVLIFDTTLRDGEQSPGASMTITEKVRAFILSVIKHRREDPIRYHRGIGQSQQG